MTRVVALTSGDPAGIGLEISFKAWTRLPRHDPFVLICDPDHAADMGHLLDLPVVTVRSAEAAAHEFSKGVPVLPVAFANRADPGSPDAGNAGNVLDTIRVAVECWRAGEVAAVCTNPVSKVVLKTGAGFQYPGQTEFLSDLSGVESGIMMLCNGDFRVVPVTVHVALRSVPGKLTGEKIERAIRVSDRALRSDFRITSPRIAVAGLNPHAGENGLMGEEDIHLIRPVVDRLAGEGMAIQGPLPADSMFHAEARESYDVAVCMYHDQALIPVKTIGMLQTVNVTLGLPFIRTSPGHGTAFDIAGKNRANERSLVEALTLARQLAANRARWSEPRDA